jgi:hypothetical protein
MDGHLLSIYQVWLHAPTTATGTVTGTVIWFPYVRLIWSTVASPKNDADVDITLLALCNMVTVDHLIKQLVAV